MEQEILDKLSIIQTQMFGLMLILIGIGVGVLGLLNKKDKR